MANLSASVLTQSTASNDANNAAFQASMQQLAANETQRNADHNRMLQQFVMMTTNNNQFAAPAVGMPSTYRATTRTGPRQQSMVPAIPILDPGAQQNYYGQPPSGGYRGGGHSRNYRGRRPQRDYVPPVVVPLPIVGGNRMIPYAPRMPAQQHQNPRNSNVVKLGEHERMLHLRFRRRRLAYQFYLPSQKNKPSRRSNPCQLLGIRMRGPSVLSQGNAQNNVSSHVTVRGGD